MGIHYVSYRQQITVPCPACGRNGTGQVTTRGSSRDGLFESFGEAEDRAHGYAAEEMGSLLAAIRAGARDVFDDRNGVSFCCGDCGYVSRAYVWRWTLPPYGCAIYMATILFCGLPASFAAASYDSKISGVIMAVACVLPLVGYFGYTGRMRRRVRDRDAVLRAQAEAASRSASEISPRGRMLMSLWGVARASRTNDPRESAVIDELCKGWGLSAEVVKMLQSQAQTLDYPLYVPTNRAEGLELLGAMIRVAAAEGQVGPQENQLIFRLANAIGVQEAEVERMKSEALGKGRASA